MRLTILLSHNVTVTLVVIISYLKVLIMNTNKENINRMPTTSKIPLPMDPLPALSENVLKKRSNSESEHRPPLKTINNQQTNHAESGGPSKKTRNVVNESKYNKIHALKLDTRHVTYRQKSEDLDWDYKVFKDKSDKENSIISISDDESAVQRSEREFQYFIKKHQRNDLEVTKKVATPVSNFLECSRVRNIKRSLKRPHSREIQGIPSIGKQEKVGNEKYKRRIQYSDRLHDRLQSPDFYKKAYMTCLSRDYTFDMFTYLLSVENKPIIPSIASITRACVINWLMKINGADGDPTTVQTACWYLDAILVVSYVKLENLQLLAAACYWISQKLHGHAVLASRLVKCASRAFTAEQLITAEKAVLKMLKFPRHPVVPQDFITYLSWCCDDEHPGEIEVAATFLCMSGVMVNKKLCEEYPSVIGAASVRNALLLLRKTHLMQRLQTCSVFKEIAKKSSNISLVCSVQRKAIRLISEPLYQYKAPLEQYGFGNHYIAQRVVKAAYALVSSTKGTGD